VSLVSALNTGLFRLSAETALAYVHPKYKGKPTQCLSINCWNNITPSKQKTLLFWRLLFHVTSWFIRFLWNSLVCACSVCLFSTIVCSVKDEAKRRLVGEEEQDRSRYLTFWKHSVWWWDPIPRARIEIKDSLLVKKTRWQNLIYWTLSIVSVLKTLLTKN